MIELDPAALARAAPLRDPLLAALRGLTDRPVSFAPYRTGSAFLRDAAP